jgi:hypothetical protein
MSRRGLIGALGALVAFIGTATAQQYPIRPISMIVPFAAGGPQDVIGRVVAQRMGEILGQQVDAAIEREFVELIASIMAAAMLFAYCSWSMDAVDAIVA